MSHRAAVPEWFGDAEPEDAWQADDPTPVLLDNLARRLTGAAERARYRDLTPLEVHRLILIAGGLAHVLNRLEAPDG